MLAGSASPGIEEVREELRTRVQAALLRGGDANLLARWTTSVHGREDSVVWESLPVHVGSSISAVFAGPGKN